MQRMVHNWNKSIKENMKVNGRINNIVLTTWRPNSKKKVIKAYIDGSCANDRIS